MQSRSSRPGFVFSPVSPSTFRGEPAQPGRTDEHLAFAEEDGGDDEAATVIWSGGQSALPSRRSPRGYREMYETPMAYVPPVPPPMPSLAPSEMDVPADTVSVPRAASNATWLPLASAACVGVALASVIFAVAMGFRASGSANAAAAPPAVVANVGAAALPVQASLTQAPRPREAAPVLPSVASHVDAPIALASPEILPGARVDATPTQPARETVAPPALPEPQPDAAVSPAKPVAPRSVRVQTRVAAPQAPAPQAPAPQAPARAASAPTSDAAVVAQPARPAVAAAKPHADDEAATAQKMLEEAQRETAGAL